MNKAQNILDRLNSLDEDKRVEAKIGSKIDHSVMETICSFSNESGMGGGDIILGVECSDIPNDNAVKTYNVIGVEDADKLQSDLASQCSSIFNIAVRPNVSIEKLNGKNVIVVTVAELDTRSKPLFFKNEGLPRGAYRRVGPTDQRCTEDDMPLFYASSESYDSMIITDTSMDDVDENAISRYRTLREKVNPQAEELDYNDQDLLLALGASKKDSNGTIRLTQTGLLVFGKSIAQRRLSPAMRIDYIRVPGTTWVADADNRFDTIDMRGPLILLVKRAYNAIVDDLPKGFVLAEGELQAERSIGMPEKVIREAIVNAFIHRTYRVNQPIQIIRYSNRIEIINPGFSLKLQEALGEPGSVLRNPFISAIFHETNIAETKGSGIGAMRRLMKKANMVPPTFESDHTRNQFTTRLLLHHFLGEEDVKWFENFTSFELSDEQKIALVFMREVGAIDNITYRQLSGVKSVKASKDLSRMTGCHLLEAKKHGNQTYYIVGEELKLRIQGPNPSTSDAYPPSLDANPPSSDANPPSSEFLSTEFKSRIEQIGKRTRDKDLLLGIVMDLCKIKPHSISEIARIIHRTDNYVKHDLVAPLREAGKLAYTIPDMINHPNQKYKVVNELYSDNITKEFKR